MLSGDFIVDTLQNTCYCRTLYLFLFYFLHPYC